MSSYASNLIDQLSVLSKTAGFPSDIKLQLEALTIARRLIPQLQKPEDAAIELCFFPAFTATARVAIDLKLFNHISKCEKPITVAELATLSGAAETLLIRLLRPLSALSFVEEVGEATWRATPITKAMCDPSVQANHIQFWDQGTAAAVHMPSFLKSTKYQQPEDPRKGLYQYAFNIDQESFEYWHTLPHVMNNFNLAMAGIRGSRPSWIEWWPVETRILREDINESAPLLVDIAGGRGHDVQAFHRKFPNHKGKLVLEDLPRVIDDIKELDSEIERVKYDLFTPQPIHGAKVYFFHFIMHDWSDDVCHGILSRTAEAMKKGYSKLLLNEFILPNQDCPLFAAGFDLKMMALHSAQERTESQWKRLLERSGFRVVKFWQPESGGEGIIEAELE